MLPACPKPRSSGLIQSFILGLSLIVFPIAGAKAAQTVSLRQIADTYAGSMVDTGRAVGVGVAIIERNNPAQYFSYGNAVAPTPSTTAQPFKPDMLFRIGSVTKVFTTNLLGQRVFNGELSLNQPLSDFSTQLGTLKPLTSQVTLGELASFSGGIIDFPPRCQANPVPGCQPASYPDLKQYRVQDLVAFVRNTVPRNYQANPPQPVSRLPAPYNYSNVAIGLTGLLLGGAPDQRLNNTAVTGWFKAVKQQILQPLAMRNTFLSIPATKSGLQIAGYTQALATATVSGGAISGLTISSHGAQYSAAPSVTIVGGGGSGARAKATLNGSHQIAGIVVKNGGSGYIAPPRIVFANGGGTIPPIADAVIVNGKVKGVFIRDRGVNLQRAPTVTISGGQTAGGRPAKLQAEIANGRLSFVRVIDPGTGYVDPLSVIISPGAPATVRVTALAPSGFLWSSLSDMATFARAAIAKGDLSQGPIAEGFRIAERPYVCNGATPFLATCPATEARTGLAWVIQLDDPVTGFPRVVSKDGGVPGYSTYVTLMPSQRVAVVVFVNSVPQIPGQQPAPAVTIASNIMNAIYYQRSAAAKGE